MFAPDLRRRVVQSWPLSRGRGLLAKAMFPLPIAGRATFSHRFGTFINAPIGSWPEGYRDLFVFDSFESEEVERWRSVIQPGDSIIDGGANIGFWTMVGATLVGENGRVVAFEPHPQTFQELCANLGASSMNNAFALNCGLWHANEDAVIDNVSNIGSRCLAQVRVPGTGERAGVPTRLAALDDLRNKDKALLNGRIKLIKLDVEGSELAALRGMERTLLTDRPILTIEWNWATSSQFGFCPRDLVKFLEDFGFRPFSWCGGRPGPFVEPPKDLSPMVWFRPD